MERKKIFSFKAEGNSMLPVLQAGDIVYIKKVPIEKIRVDDIVFIHSKSKQFIHRVVYKKNDNDNQVKYFITKGDNNLHSDGKINVRDVLGIVFQIKRKDQIFGIDDLYLFQSSIYLKEILKIKKSLGKKSVEFLILKGLPLHLYFEKTHPRRVYADCDLLVKLKDLPFIKKIFLEHGYSQIDTEYSQMHKNLKDKLTEINMFKKVNGIPISFDIHFEPVFLMNQIGKMNALYPDKLLEDMTKEFFIKKHSVSHEGNTYPILSPIHLVMYLSLHFFHHNFREAFRLKLIESVIKRNFHSHKSVTFTNLLELINKYKVNNFVYPVFVLLEKDDYCEIPENFMLRIRPNKRFLKYINKNILNKDPFSSEPKIKAGIQRFKNIFFLSPQPFLRKIQIFGNPAIIYSIFWVLRGKIKKIVFH